MVSNADLFSLFPATPLEKIRGEQEAYICRKREEQRKSEGQFFTAPEIASYMASMARFAENVETLRILDAGAGAGILTFSLCMRALELGHQKVHAVLYEIDEGILPLLKRTMDSISEIFSEKNYYFTYDIRHADFLLDRPDKKDAPFHLSSINPPYFKYNSKTSPYSSATTDLFKGNPNVYASFMAAVGASLAPNGEMIAIVPRSFSNGLYFKGFRNYLLENFSLDRIHLFRSRGDLFKKLNVLQENIICHFSNARQGDVVEIISSDNDKDMSSSERNLYPIDLIVDRANSHNIIRIPDTKSDADILKTVEEWPETFSSIGYYISTGPVVEHRTREFVLEGQNTGNTIPLLRMHNLKNFSVEWSGEHRKDASFKLIQDSEKHVTKSSNYLLLKRFTSKEEKKRLVASVYNHDSFRSKYIAFENHINFIGHSSDSLSLTEVLGLSALFNSTFIDKYFRSISGNTQVNATEIRLLRLPRRETIVRIGEELKSTGSIGQRVIDSSVNTILNLGEHQHGNKREARIETFSSKGNSSQPGFAKATI